MTVTVYVKLLGEGTEVWRPVPAELVLDNLYRLTNDPAKKPADEAWEFDLGALVKCGARKISVGECLVAIEEVH